MGNLWDRSCYLQRVYGERLRFVHLIRKLSDQVPQPISKTSAFATVRLFATAVRFGIRTVETILWPQFARLPSPDQPFLPRISYASAPPNPTHSTTPAVIQTSKHHIHGSRPVLAVAYPGVADKLAAVLGTSERVFRNVDLAPYTTFKIGGPADLFVEPRSADELCAVLKVAYSSGIPHFVLGLGANILVGDCGFRGLIIRNRANAISVLDDGTVIAESGVIVFPDLIDVAVAAGLSGLEHYVGIPSTVGGALWQNLHFLSPAPERLRTMFIEEVVLSADVLERDGRRHNVDRDYFNFGYDYSTLHDSEAVVLSASFALENANQQNMRRIMSENLDWRRARHPPLDAEPSAGSIFKKIDGVGAGRLIDQAGLKGTRVGGAEVTRRHANILINRDQATASDVRKLINYIQAVVVEKSGYVLETEIRFVGDFCG